MCKHVQNCKYVYLMPIDSGTGHLYAYYRKLGFECFDTKCEKYEGDLLEDRKILNEKCHYMSNNIQYIIEKIEEILNTPISQTIQNGNYIGNSVHIEDGRRERLRYLDMFKRDYIKEYGEDPPDGWVKLFNTAYRSNKSPIMKVEEIYSIKK